jgi:uncharacterized protein with PIN domain
VIFCDTSALAKYYVPEAESAALASRLDAEDAVVVSELARVELMSVFHRRMRERSCISRFLKACFYAQATVYTSLRRCLKGSRKSARSIAASKRRCRHLVSLLLPSSLHR